MFAAADCCDICTNSNYSSPSYDLKPGYFAIQTLTSFLTGYQFDSYIAQNLTSYQDYIIQLTDGSLNTAYAAWSISKHEHDVQIPVSTSQCFTAISYLGTNSTQICPEFGLINVTITDGPTYLKLL
jgi:hypothetical protein